MVQIVAWSRYNGSDPSQPTECSIKKPVKKGRRYSTPIPCTDLMMYAWAETSTLLECDRQLRGRNRKGRSWRLVGGEMELGGS